MTRRAISPRLATRIFWNTSLPSARLDVEELFPELHRLGVLRVDGDHRARDVRLDLVHELHRLDYAEGLALFDDVADLHESLGIRVRGAVERADDRRRDDVEDLPLSRAGGPRSKVR